MEPRTYKFLLAEDKKDGAQSKVDIKTIEALSFQEALADAFVHLHTLRTSTEKTWRIIKVTDTTHFHQIRAL